MEATDALFGFVAWLTTRKQVVSFGASHDCAEALEVLSRFIKVNNLPDVSDKYPTNFEIPRDSNDGIPMS